MFPKCRHSPLFLGDVQIHFDDTIQMSHSPHEKDAAEGLISLSKNPKVSYSPPPKIRDPSVGKVFYDPGEGHEGYLASPAPTLTLPPGGRRRKTRKGRRVTKKRRFTRRR
jgi:hypothetical protein